jgi:NADPH2:quinone reductase
MLVKNYSVIGLYWGAYSDRGSHDIVLAAHDDLMTKFREGRIHADVTKAYPLDEVLEALAALESRTVTGRLVVTP